MSFYPLNPGPVKVFGTFPSGWTGSVSYESLNNSSLVILKWALSIAVGTVVSGAETVYTLPSGFYYPSDSVIVVGNVTGGGLTGQQYCPMYVQTTGAFEYNGPAFTVTGATAFCYGQAVYPNNF